MSTTPKFYRGFDGEPLLVVALTATQVEHMAWTKRREANEHWARIENDLTEPRIEAQKENQREAGRWDVLNEQMSTHFWDWVNDRERDELPLHPDYRTGEEIKKEEVEQEVAHLDPDGVYRLHPREEAKQEEVWIENLSEEEQEAFWATGYDGDETSSTTTMRIRLTPKANTDRAALEVVENGDDNE